MAKPYYKPSAEKVDFREAITAKIVADLEKGEIPWRKPWLTRSSLPANAISGKAYKNMNALLLFMEIKEKNWGDHRFVTFKQAGDLGGNVKRGEKGNQIEFWEKVPFYKRADVSLEVNSGRIKVASEDLNTIQTYDGRTIDKSQISVFHGNDVLRWKDAEGRLSKLVSKTHVVFNADQCENLNLKPLDIADKQFNSNEKVQTLLDGMKADGLKFTEGGSSAFYSPMKDMISLPNKNLFESEDKYYATMLHEMGHSTGHESRLNRDLKNQFGTEAYAKEELIAELTSSFMGAETGLVFEDKSHSAYIQSWLKSLKEDKNEIFVAAKQAYAASDYLLEKSAELEKAKEVVTEIDKQPEISEIKKEPIKKPQKQVEMEH